MKKTTNTIFICIIILFLLSGLIRTIFFPKDLIYAENRYANKISAFSLEQYLTGSFQEQLSAALNDQVLLSGNMKKVYNKVTSSYEKSVLFSFTRNLPPQYVSIKNGLLFDDYIVYGTYDYSSRREKHQQKAANIIDMANNHRNLNFYIYYIEKDTDINFESNEKIGAYENLESQFQKADIPFSGLRINNFDDFKNKFYKTDHHWNCYGSYQGYQEVLTLIDPQLIPLPAKDEIVLDYPFSGSKAIALGVTDQFIEEFPVYIFDYPSMDISINGSPYSDYGNQDSFVSGTAENLTYGNYYGGDNGEIIFKTINNSGRNLLVIGESYDNAILKLLATHFDTTHSIDLRYYQSTFNKNFSFNQYVTDYEITDVLLIGNIDYFTMEEFLLEE